MLLCSVSTMLVQKVDVLTRSHSMVQ
uniref:Uncharacterized protein n=1 Tax=Anguilla anguilla TaxID=7936 RepID=A0A0E9VSL7_ANGAN